MLLYIHGCSCGWNGRLSTDWWLIELKELFIRGGGGKEFDMSVELKFGGKSLLLKGNFEYPDEEPSFA